MPSLSSIKNLPPGAAILPTVSLPRSCVVFVWLCFPADLTNDPDKLLISGNPCGMNCISLYVQDCNSRPDANIGSTQVEENDAGRTLHMHGPVLPRYVIHKPLFGLGLVLLASSPTPFADRICIAYCSVHTKARAAPHRALDDGRWWAGSRLSPENIDPKAETYENKQ